MMENTQKSNSDDNLRVFELFSPPYDTKTALLVLASCPLDAFHKIMSMSASCSPYKMVGVKEAYDPKNGWSHHSTIQNGWRISIAEMPHFKVKNTSLELAKS